MRLVNIADGVLEHCDVCRAFEKVLRGPIADTSAAAMFAGRLQADLLYLDNIIRLLVRGFFPEYFLLIPVRTQNPQEGQGAFSNSRIGVFGPPQCVQTDEGKKWKRELRPDLRPKRRIK